MNASIFSISPINRHFRKPIFSKHESTKSPKKIWQSLGEVGANLKCWKNCQIFSACLLDFFCVDKCQNNTREISKQSHKFSLLGLLQFLLSQVINNIPIAKISVRLSSGYPLLPLTFGCKQSTSDMKNMENKS